MDELVDKEELLETQEEMLVNDKERINELEKLLALEKEKNEKVDLELAKCKETITSLESSNVALQDKHNVLVKTHNELEVQFDTLWSSTSSSSCANKSTKASTSVGCERCYKLNVDTNACVSHKKTIDALESKVNSLMAQALEIKKKNDDEKVKYARSVHVNTRRPHVKSGIGYTGGAKHNARENTKGQTFIKFAKEGTYQKKQEKSKMANRVSHAYHANAHAYHAHDNVHASNASQILFRTFDASYVLMKNVHGKVYAKYVGPRNKKSKTCVWVPKSLVANVKGPNMVWVPKNKT